MAEPTKETQIGFHRGALSVLAAEQNELMKMVSVTQQIAQAHIKALKDLGVDIEAEMKQAQEAMQKQQAAQGQAPQGAQPGADDLADRLG